MGYPHLFPSPVRRRREGGFETRPYVQVGRARTAFRRLRVGLRNDFKCKAPLTGEDRGEGGSAFRTTGDRAVGACVLIGATTLPTSPNVLPMCPVYLSPMYPVCTRLPPIFIKRAGLKPAPTYDGHRPITLPPTAYCLPERSEGSGEVGRSPPHGQRGGAYVQRNRPPDPSSRTPQDDMVGTSHGRPTILLMTMKGEERGEGEEGRGVS